MKVKMLEYYQDARVSLTPDQEADVDSGLGNWLVANHKAIRLEIVAPHYGAQSEPQLRDDEKIYEAMRHLDVEPQFEQAETPPQPEPAPKKRGRK